MPESSSKQTITSIERAADVLLLFARTKRRDLGVTEIAKELSISKAVVYRILHTLATRSLVTPVEESRRYRLGPGALTLGMSYLDHHDIRAEALPWLRWLSARTDETATLSQRFNSTRIYVEQVTPAREVHMSVAIGQPFPLHAGSSSKAFLAFLPAEEREHYLKENALEAVTEITVTDPDLLRTELTRIRERGFATSLGERQPGAGSVAAPVLDYRDQPVAVISVCGPVDRFQEEFEATTGLLLEATTALSATLGHPKAG